MFILKNESGEIISKLSIICLLLLFHSSQNAHSQTFASDVIAIGKNLSVQTKINLKNETKPKKFWQDNDFSSPTKDLARASISFYQNFISTQDLPVCSFKPSCSRFSVEAFRNANFIVGLLLTSDRLQRDFRFGDSHSQYLFDPKSEKFLDPIADYIDLKGKNEKQN